MLAIATKVDIGVENGVHGWLVVFSDDIRKFPRFAEAMIRHRKEFNALRLSAPRIPKPAIKSVESGQYKLPM